MEITVQYTGKLAGITGASEERVEVSEGTSVQALVDQLCAKHPQKYGELLRTHEGDMRPSTLVILDGEQAGGDPSEIALDGFETLMLMTPIAGG